MSRRKFAASVAPVELGETVTVVVRRQAITDAASRGRSWLNEFEEHFALGLQSGAGATPDS